MLIALALFCFICAVKASWHFGRADGIDWCMKLLKDTDKTNE